MANFIEDLKNRVLLSYHEIIAMKTLIMEQFTEDDTHQRAERLAKDVHIRLSSELSGIPEEMRESIRHSILKQCIVEEKRDIFKIDVLNTISDLDHSIEERIAISKQWLDSNTSVPYTTKELNVYFEQRKVFETRASSSRPKSRSKSRLPFLPLSITLTLIFMYIIVLKVPSTSLWHKNAEEVFIERLEYTSSQNIFAPHLELIHKINKLDESHLQYVYVSVKNPFAIESQDFAFSDIRYLELRNYLILDRDSFLAQTQFNYLSEVILLSQLHDIDPLLLLAIIGQEQGFVPSDSDYKHLIINNPFNVFYSWKRYNTSFVDSTTIAINFIQDRLSSRPVNQSAFQWLNEVYAEDPNWSKGVQIIYSQLQDISRKTL